MRDALDLHLGAPASDDPQLQRSGVAQVDDPVAVEGPAIVDPHDHLAIVARVADPRIAGNRQGRDVPPSWHTCRRPRRWRCACRGTCGHTRRRARVGGRRRPRSAARSRDRAWHRDDWHRARGVRSAAVRRAWPPVRFQAPGPSPARLAGSGRSSGRPTDAGSEWCHNRTGRKRLPQPGTASAPGWQLTIGAKVGACRKVSGGRGAFVSRCRTTTTPPQPALKKKLWRVWLESNQRPSASEADTLSTELQTHSRECSRLSAALRRTRGARGGRI